MRRACLIINPNSGANRRRPGLQGRIEGWARESGIDASVRLTTHRGHAIEIARGATGFDCVVAVGGDGTVNEVACGAIDAGIPVGILPCGSGNGLARYLKIPLDLRKAVRVLASGPIRTIDSGIANGHRFFNAAGVGFDAEICRRFNDLTKRGLLRYVRTGAQAYREYRPERYSIASDSGTVSLEAFVITIANSDQYGNNARIAPGARADDGLLDLVAIRPANLVSTAATLLRLFAGSIDRSASVTRIAGTRFTIRRARAGVMHVDGESRQTEAIVEVAILPRSLSVIAGA